MINVALIEPCFQDEWNKSLYENKENLGLGYIASYLEAEGYHVDIINQNYSRYSDEQLISLLALKEYSFIGISCSAQKTYPAARNLIQLIRKKFCDVHICMGGVFASIEYENILKDLPELSTIVIGEGEYTTLKILKQIEANDSDYSQIPGVSYFDENNTIITTKAERIHELDNLPFPKRLDNIFAGKVRKEYITMFAGRGCYGNCSYCSIQKSHNYRRKIYRTPRYIVDEIQALIDKYGINYFHFHDDIFYDRSQKSIAWLYDFMNELKTRNVKIKFRIYLRPNDIRDEEIVALKEVGLDNVFIGVETGVQRILDEMNKNVKVEESIEAIRILQKHGIKINMGFITFIPTMTFEEVLQNYQFLFASECYIEANLHNRLNIYAGCEYINILRDEGLLLPQESFWGRHYYLFKNTKVENLYNTVQETKKYFLGTRNLINEIEDLCIAKDMLNKFNLVKDKSLGLWKTIIENYLEVLKTQNSIEQETIDRQMKLIDRFCVECSNFLEERKVESNELSDEKYQNPTKKNTKS